MFTEFNEILWKFMKVYDNPWNQQNFLGKIIHFHSLSFICDVLCWLSLSILVISKFWFCLDNFEILNLVIMIVKKVIIVDTYLANWLLTKWRLTTLTKGRSASCCGRWWHSGASPTQPSRSRGCCSSSRGQSYKTFLSVIYGFS